MDEIMRTVRPPTKGNGLPMKSLLIAITCLHSLFISGLACANVGVFSGRGFTVELQRTAAIQLVDESVNFDFKGEEFSRIYSQSSGLSGDYVEVRGFFTLKNLTDSTVTIQVGFPLNGDHVFDYNYERSKESIDDSISALEKMRSLLNFSVRDASHTYDLRYVAKDESEHYRGIFLWDMEFVPDGVKTLEVSYRIELSQTIASTEEIFFRSMEDQRAVAKDSAMWHYEKEWYEYLTGAYLEYFEYVTSTAKSWAGPPGKARFRANIGDFQMYLHGRGIFGQDSGDTRAVEPRADSSKSNPPLSDSTITLTRITPSGSQSQGGRVEWSYSSFPADSDLTIEFWFTTVPRDSIGLDSLIAGMIGINPTKEDLSDLRDIVAAMLGIQPNTPRVIKFAQRQIWYASNNWTTEDKLSPEERSLLDHLSDRVNQAK